MKTILLLGAGLSSSSLIRYFLQHAEANDWFLRVCDKDMTMVRKKLGNHPNATALSFNALSSSQRKPEIEMADLVISMLPARFHIEVANDCIALKTNLITPSYISPEMKALDRQARHAGIIIMNEIGVDPGIDHMSASKILDHLKLSKVHILHEFVDFMQCIPYLAGIYRFFLCIFI
jgi:saccharopine dehydrogenase-like NADP-dependent oxidoreductase